MRRRWPRVLPRAGSRPWDCVLSAGCALHSPEVCFPPFVNESKHDQVKERCHGDRLPPVPLARKGREARGRGERREFITT